MTQVIRAEYGYSLRMYLRTTKRKNKDGSVVAYYPLAHNHWDPDNQRSRV